MPPPSDLPCDVADLLGTRCVPCHADPPRGASESFTSLEALRAPSVSDPSRSVAEVAIELMGSTTNPMPPAPAAPGTDAEIAVLQGFVDGGLSMGTCAVIDPYDTPVMCTRDSFWRGGNRESTRMHPGLACIDCHATRRGPWFSVAGTVYPSAHEPDDCNGATANGSDVPTVEITDAIGRSVQLDVNSAGNFFSQSRFRLPYTARVLYQGRSRVMVTPQDSGDCNTCHTEAGDNGAPGRILLP